MRNIFKKICCLIFVLLFTNPIEAIASQIEYSNVYSIDQYTPVKFREEKNDDGSSLIIGESYGLEKGYYTSYIYKNVNSNLSTYGGVWLEINNLSTNDTSINLNIAKSNYDQLYLKNNKGYIVEEDEIMYSKVSQFDGVNIKGQENVKMYIPFSSLCDNKDELRNIDKLGLLVTIAENQECKLKVNNINLVSSIEAEKYENSLFGKISGDDTLMIAVQGESITKLNIEGKNNNTYKFKEIAEYPGITLTKDGELISNSNADEGIIEVIAIDNAGVAIKHEVNLYKSWRESDEIDISQKFLTPKEIEKPSDTIPNIVNKNIVITYRIVLLIIPIVLIVPYIIIRKKMKTQEKMV